MNRIFLRKGRISIVTGKGTGFIVKLIRIIGTETGFIRKGWGISRKNNILSRKYT